MFPWIKAANCPLNFGHITALSASSSGPSLKGLPANLPIAIDDTLAGSMLDLC